MSQSASTVPLTTSSIPDGDATTRNPFLTMQEEYRKFHGYVSCIVCIFGLSSNIINFIVLTRKHMIKPVNCILAALAVADFLTMLSYIIVAVCFYIIKKPTWQDNHSYAWMYFMMIHNHFILICHSMSLWFTVYLSWLRHKFVCNNKIGSRVYSLKKTIKTIVIITLVIILICVPNFFLYKVVSLQELGYTNVDGFWIVYSNFVDEHEIYKVLMFWIFAVAMRILPCLLLTVFISRIIYTMKWSNVRRKQLSEHSTLTSIETDRDRNRITRMLMAVVIICVLTETPQGILAMIGALNDYFFENVYANIGDILDVLVLLNSSVNFILYCLMCRQFRNTVVSLFSLRTRPN